MDHLVGLDISMDEAHVCVLDRAARSFSRARRRRRRKRSLTHWRARLMSLATISPAS
jgi:hypothetical protein